MAAASSLLADPDYLRLKEHLVRSTGLAYYADKDDDLSGRIGRRLAALGLHDCSSYLSVLHDAAKGDAELDALVVELTIGETYFFRYSEQFDALRGIVLPDILERNQASRRLRIWSAGCATGAEPYSVALVLQQDLADRIAGWDVTILGTDVNRSFLARAREGRFEEWAFRATPQDVKLRCFQKRETAWVIRPEFKEGVSFQYHNLAKHPFPSLVNNLLAFDLILCRNVMIYFEPGMVRTIAEQFRECLVERGWLLVGHAEPNTEIFRGFRIVNSPGAILYQKSAAPAAEVSAATPHFDWLPPAPAELPAPAQEPAGPAPPVQRTETPVSPDDLHGLPRVRLLADQGDWQNASLECRRLLESDGLEPVVHFYYALILEQSGDLAEAEVSLRRALYLDRGFVLAHYHLGLFLQRKGDARQAVRSFENVLELLSRKGDAFRFADGDGMTAGGLRELTQMQLEVLRG